ncbi:MAG: DUF1080 domain-containing protein [Bacteroides sp.]|nr:DUF1080 domain-containing protein [Bacteroides sp.]
MKKLFIILALAALLPWSVAAQDARMRTSETIIADGLNQLPASEKKTFDTVMGELVSTGAEGIAQIAGMLVPASEGKNAVVEYALNGVVAYATTPGKDAEKAVVRQGLKQALEACTDNPNKAFLLTLLRNCGVAEDAPVFVKYLNDEYLAEWAISGLTSIDGTEEILLDLMKKEAAPKVALAHAAGIKKMASAEPILLAWLKNADAPTARAIYQSLAQCGTSLSLPVLGKAAKKVGYAWEESDATAAYLRLMKKLVAEGQAKSAVVAAKALLKDTDKSHVRGAALDIVVSVDGKKALPYLIAALKNDNRYYRVNALRLSGSIADEAWYATLAKTLKGKADASVKADILNWLGTNHVASQVDEVVAQMNASDEEVALAAIGAAGKIGGESALSALIAQLGGAHSPAAEKALLAFNGKVDVGILKALDSEKKVLLPVMRIASERSMEEGAEKVFGLLTSSDAEISGAAYQALAGVVEPTHFNQLSALLEKGQQVPAIQKAMKNALLPLSKADQLANIQSHMGKSANASLYYPVLAQVGTSEAIAEIRKGYEGNYKQAAYEALLTIDNAEMIPVLFEMAQTDKTNAQTLLNRYTDLVNKSSQTPIQKFQSYSKALELASDVKLQNRLLSLLGGTHTYQALLVAAPYMDNQPTSESAATAVRTIVSKNIETLGGEQIRQMLNKAITCFEAVGDADAGYAIDDIKAMLEKLPEVETSPKFELSAEEAKEGFEVLFDGEDMSKWIGNTIDYVPMNGAICVSAKYGNGGNLYTEKEYSDFIFRFEFCFMKEGVNNGVGIRTPMGVDAAYEGMEIQILDHDAPIYKNLREYQVHGSVYGIIPAKRIKSPKLGTWNTEEIWVKGDRIKVTVNGEVILDGNIRKACKGNNVSKDGSKTNPYTVDKKNHPGLFNKSGHIGFLGHGEGLKLRNVRIKDLSK